MCSRGGDVGSLAVSTSQPVSVIRRVCSNCADLYPSVVVLVHLSGQVTSFQTPAFIIGSIVKICPGFMKPTALLLE